MPARTHCLILCPEHGHVAQLVAQSTDPPGAELAERIGGPKGRYTSGRDWRVTRLRLRCPRAEVAQQAAIDPAAAAWAVAGQSVAVVVQGMEHSATRQVYAAIAPSATSDPWLMPLGPLGFIHCWRKPFAGMGLSAIVAVLPILTGCQGNPASPLEGAATLEPPGRAVAEFGIWTVDAAGEDHFVPISEVPNVEDQPYGWRIWVGESKEPVRWAERLTLSNAPDSWEGVDENPNMTISPDGRTVTTAGESIPEAGYISNTWYVAEGDPLGEYEISVQLSVGHEETFRFQLRSPPPDPIEPPTVITA